MYKLHGEKRRRARHTALTALAALAMMGLVYFLLGVAPFGDNTVITGDLNGQYLSYFSHFQRAAAGEAGFLYGFDKSLGGPLAGLFAYYVSSPLNLVYLLAPVSSFAVVAGFVLAAKIVLASVFFQVYISRKLPALGWKSALLGLCYGFCAYNFAYAQNIMWHDVVLLLPLICLGIDHILAGKTNRLYLVCLSLAIWANFYIAFMACVFAVLYFAASALAAGTRPARLKKPLLSFMGGSLFAGGINGALLLPTLLNVGDSKGGLSEFVFSLTANFNLLQLPQKLLWGSFRAEADAPAGLPLVYCGLVCLPLALCFFISRRLPPRQKLAAGGLLGALVLCFWVEGLNNLWHGLNAAVWFPYRYSFLFCFVLVTLSGAAWAKGAARGKTLLLACGLSALVPAAYILFPGAMGGAKLLACAGALVGFGLLLALAARAKRPAASRLFALALALAVGVELAANAWYMTNQFEKYPNSEYVAFLAETGGAAKAVAEADGGVYRMDKTYFRSFNDPMLLGYRGVSHFGSTQDAAATGAREALGYAVHYPSYLYGSTAFADSVLGLKYLIDDGSRPAPGHWQSAGIDAEKTLLQNPTALPLVFTLPAGGETAMDFGDGADSFSYQNALYAALSGEGEPLFLDAPARLLGADGEALPFMDSLAGEEYFEVVAEEAGYYYAVVKAAGGALYDLPLLLNGEPKGDYFSADHTGVIDLGYLHPGQRATLSWAGGGALLQFEAVRFAYMQPQKLEALAAVAKANTGSFTFADGAVRGSFTAAPGRETLFTSIPYHSGWRASVNGKAVTPAALGEFFLTIPLEEGENLVELRYTQAGLGAGVAVTLGTAAVYAAALLLLRRRRANKAAGAAPKPETQPETKPETKEEN